MRDIYGISTESIDIEIIRGFYEQLYASKLNNLEWTDSKTKTAKPCSRKIGNREPYTY